MTNGLRITNTSGYLQIDSTYKNHSLRTKGTVMTTASYGSARSNSTATITVANCANPFIFFRSSVYVSNMNLTVSGSTYSFIVQAEGTVGQSVDYYVFDEPIQQSPTHGLRLYNETTGALVFESGQKYLRIVDYQMNLSYASSGSNSFTYATGRTYAFGFATSGFQMVNIPEGPGGLPAAQLNLYAVGGKSITHGVTLGSWWAVQSAGPNTSGVYTLPTHVLIADVTGY